MAQTETMRFESMTDRPRTLLVDDDDLVRTALSEMLVHSGFRVTSAANVREALHLIDTETFEVLLTDLHMPGAGDGFTVITAMHHTQPKALTFLLTGYPEFQAAMNAILAQADEVLVKPVPPSTVISIICERLKNRNQQEKSLLRQAAYILGQQTYSIIENWLAMVRQDASLMSLPLNTQQRVGHLPKLLEKLVLRLYTKRDAGAITLSTSAFEHGRRRYFQGYSLGMMKEETRLLHVVLFQTLQSQMSNVDFEELVSDLQTVDEELDGQLKCSLVSFKQGKEPSMRASN